MSAIQQMMLAGRGQVTVTGSLSGSGSLSIPDGVTSITLTGNGSGGTVGTAATFATATLTGVLPDGYATPSTITATIAGQLNNNHSPWPWPAPSSVQITISADGSRAATSFRYQSGISPNYERSYFVGGEYAGYASALYSATNGTNATPGTAGTATTASIQSQNINFAGASTGVISAPAPTVQTFNGLSGAASSMTYSVPAGGSLSYSYSY